MLQENIRRPETMSWWMKGGVEREGEVQERWDVKHRSENQRSSSAEVGGWGGWVERWSMQRRGPSSVELTQPVFTAWPRVSYSSIAEVPRTSPFWRIWCEIQEGTRLNVSGPGFTHTHSRPRASAGRAAINERDPDWIHYLLQLSLGLVLHPPDVLHGQTHPSVDPAEQLAVKVCENPFFLLGKRKKGRKERVETGAEGGVLLAALVRALPCGWSSPLWSADPTIWTWRSPACTHTCEDIPTSARAVEGRRELITHTPPLTANLCLILYLPLRTKRPSARLRGLEQSRIFLRLVVLKPHKDANVNKLLR